MNFERNIRTIAQNSYLDLADAIRLADALVIAGRPTKRPVRVVPALDLTTAQARIDFVQSQPTVIKHIVDGKFIQAIKEARMLAEQKAGGYMGLKEAKDAVDHVRYYGDLTGGYDKNNPF